ncbi:unnamed protein product, partial [marine sediment metagenome]
DPKSGRQRLFVQTSDGKEFTSIDCVHAAICQVPVGEIGEVEGEMRGAETQEEIEQIWERYESTEELPFDLNVDEKWFAFKSWAQGIAESGWNAIDLMSEMDAINPAFPIAHEILSFVVNRDPKYLDEYMSHVEKECKNHKPCVLARLDKIKTENMDANALVTLKAFEDEYEPVKSLNLSKKKLKAVPSNVGNVKNLEKLYLDGNKLKTLPESVGNLKNLKMLYLHRNELDTIPENVGNLKRLKYLDLGKNELKTLQGRIQA